MLVHCKDVVDRWKSMEKTFRWRIHWVWWCCYSFEYWTLPFIYIFPQHDNHILSYIRSTKLLVTPFIYYIHIRLKSNITTCRSILLLMLYYIIIIEDFVLATKKLYTCTCTHMTYWKISGSWKSRPTAVTGHVCGPIVLLMPKQNLVRSCINGKLKGKS